MNIEKIYDEVFEKVREMLNYDIKQFFDEEEYYEFSEDVASYIMDNYNLDRLEMLLKYAICGIVWDAIVEGLDERYECMHNGRACVWFEHIGTWHRLVAISD